VAADTLSNQFQELLGLIKAGKLDVADRLAVSILLQDPGFAPGWATASRIATLRRNWPRALECANRAVGLEPANARYLVHQAHALWAMGETTPALRTAERSRDCCASDPIAWQHLGRFYFVAERFAAACDAYEHAVALLPGSADAHFNLGAAMRIVGRLEEAESEYDRAIALRPADYEAYYNRAELRPQSPERNHITELEQILAGGVRNPRGEVFIRYALAKELEDLSRYEDSFRHLQAGAVLRRHHLNYDVALDVATFDWISREFPVERVRVSSSRDGGPVPIFVVGLPRTGTTLVERILGGHRSVVACGELPHFSNALSRAAHGVAGSAALSREQLVKISAGLDFEALGADYLARVRVSAGDSPFFVDKMPLNFLYLGLIRRALPQARIIHLVRHPLATCYAIYKTLFQDAYPFSYDLGEIAAYYAGYRRLMQHWHSVLPGIIHDVSYEMLVRDFEPEARRVLTFSGLEWQPACAEFHRNPHPSTTASAAQVRRPLYSSAVSLWRHYQRELEPLRGFLIEAGVPEAELDS
jgi:cytochrome c-type biogenesis protein CcmH/NrfG